MYRQAYGSPEVDQTEPKIRRAIVSQNGRSVRLIVNGIVQGHVHEFTVAGVRDTTGSPLVHTKAYYTVNEIPR